MIIKQSKHVLTHNPLNQRIQEAPGCLGNWVVASDSAESILWNRLCLVRG